MNVTQNNFKTLLLVSLSLLTFTFSLSLAQEVKEKKVNETSKIEKPNIPQVVEGDVIFKDGDNNQLIRITDEGTSGAIQFINGVPLDTDFKLYRSGPNLFFGTTALGSGSGGATEIDQLTDGKSDATSVFLGNGAGSSDDGTNNYNSAIGINALYSNSTGYKNTANGYQALYSNSTGYSNGAHGHQALYSNSTGIGNTANGNEALYLNTTGNHNTAIGTWTLRENTTGNHNTAIGSYALWSNTTGESNVGIGLSSNYYNQEGSNNTIIGYEAGTGMNIHDKSGNVFLGYKAGYYESGDNKLYIENSNSTSPLIWGDFTNGSEQVKINGKFSVGDNSSAFGARSLAGGNNSQSHGEASIAFGKDNLAWGDHSSAFGLGSKAHSYLTTAIGRFNVGNGILNQTNWVATDPLFEIGNGADDANRSNAFTVLKNGNVGIGLSAPSEKLEVSGTARLKNLEVGGNGTKILEIIEIAADLSSLSETTISYPSLYTSTNSRIVSLELKETGTNTWVPGGFYPNITASKNIYYQLQPGGIYVFHIGGGVFEKYRIVLMKI